MHVILFPATPGMNDWDDYSVNVHSLNFKKHHLDYKKRVRNVCNKVKSVKGGALIRATLPNLQDIDLKRGRTTALKILTQPRHTPSSPPPTGRCLCCLRTKTEKMKTSFVPQAIRLLGLKHSNSNPVLESYPLHIFFFFFISLIFCLYSLIFLKRTVGRYKANLIVIGRCMIVHLIN